MANLANIIPAIFTGPNGQRLTPEQIAERQQIAQSLMAQATDTSPNAGGVASILAKGVQGFAAGRSRNQADAAVGANAKASSANVASLLGLLGGGSSAPIGQGATVANPMVAGAPVDVSQNGETFSPFIETVKSTITNPYGLSAVAATGKAESGWSPANANRSWSDPSESGKAGTAGGILSWRGPRLAALQSYAAEKGEQGNGSPQTQAEFFLREDPNLVASLNNAKSVEEAQSTINKAWAFAGYDRPGGEAGRRLQYASSYLPQFQGANAAAAMETAAPASGYVDPMVKVVPNTQQPTAQQSPMASAPPMQQSPMQTAQASPATNPTVIEALSSPYASEQERSVAGLLLNQTMSQQQAAQAKALKQQERQQEIARRQQIAQQSGIDPAYAQDDELWKGATGQIFAAPSTSTVNNTVIDNRTGKPIYQAPAQNYRQITGPDAAAIGLDPSKAYNVGPDGKIAPIGDSGVTVNNNMGGDKFGEEFAKLDAKALDTVATSGQAAQRNLGRINQLGELLKSSPTGFEGAVAQRAGEWGIPTKGLDTLQAAQAAINSLVPEQRQPGSGPMSDADLALFKQSLPRIINQPGGNDLIINTMKSIAQYDAEGANIVQQLRSGKMDRAQAFEALQNRVNPLDSFKAPGEPAENPMPDQPQTGWKDLGNGVKIRPKGSN